MLQSFSLGCFQCKIDTALSLSKYVLLLNQFHIRITKNVKEQFK